MRVPATTAAGPVDALPQDLVDREFSQITWTNFSGQVTIDYPNGITSTRSYDAAGRLQRIHDRKFVQGQPLDLLDLRYTHDAKGQVASQTLLQLPGATTQATGPSTALTGSSETIGRDLLDRVTSVNPEPVPGVQPPVEGYAYAGGNLTTRSLGTIPDAFQYDPAHQLIRLITSATRTTFAHDALGQRTASTTVDNATLGVHGIQYTRKYSYDQAGRLTRFVGPPLHPGGVLQDARVGTFKYDGLSRNAALDWNMVEGTPRILGDLSNTYVTGPRGIVLEQLTGLDLVPVYLHSDQIGSTRLVTSESGQPLAGFDYDAYGQSTFTPLAELSGLGVSAPVTPIQYAGSYTELTTGLIYMLARWYDPSTAGFLTRDPIEDATGQPYSYANHNPIDLTDPTGMCPWCLAFAAGLWVASLDASTQLSAAVDAGACNPFEHLDVDSLLNNLILGVAVEVGAGLALAGIAARIGAQATARVADEFGQGSLDGIGYHNTYIDLTRGSSIRNVGTSTTRDAFENNLERSGWVPRWVDNGSVRLWEKDGAKYAVRAKNSSGYPGHTADFTPAGGDKTLEIRLGYSP